MEERPKCSRCEQQVESIEELVSHVGFGNGLICMQCVMQLNRIKAQKDGWRGGW